MIELDVLSASEQAADEAARAVRGRPRAWRSAAHRDGADEAAYDREFLDAPSAADGHASRRTFLKVMGASTALAGLAGCRRPVENILPYARKPQDVVPGVANVYATTMPLGGVGRALLVQSNEGRPTKVEGNPEHPVSQGATGLFAQASVLSLYDPDRSRHVTHRGEAGPARADWGSFVAEANRLINRRGEIRLAVLAGPSASPTEATLREQLLQTYPNARWVTLGALGDDTQALGTQAALGRPARPLYRFSEADVIVALDADFLASDDPNTVWNNREYARSRRVEDREAAGRPAMSRFYAAESTLTMTGGMADHRAAMKAGKVPFFAAALAGRLGVGAGVTGGLTPYEEALVEAVAADVQGAAGRAVFVAGATQPAQVHALAAALNGRFGGGAVEYLDAQSGPVEPVGPQLRRLVADMRSGALDVVLCLDTNPVYTLPAELEFAEALEAMQSRGGELIHAGLWRDETAQRAAWHLPLAHYLEAWGDARAYDGTLSVVQPLIAPLYDDAHSVVEVLNTLATGRNNAGYDLVRRSFQGSIGGNFEDGWRTLLHDGFVPDSGFASLGAGGGAAVDLSGLEPPTTGVELVVRLSPTLYDGTFSNNAWMQETPDPVTKVTWDGVALMSAATAGAYGLDVEEDAGKAYAGIVRITANGAAAELPVWVQPGHPDDSVTVHLGYGRQIETDREARGEGWLGFFNKDVDPYEPGPVANAAGAWDDRLAVAQRAEPLRALGAMTVVPSVQVERSGGDYLVATTQDHGRMKGDHAIETGQRAIARYTTLDAYREDPAFAKDENHFIEDTPWEAFPPLWGEENAASDDPRIEQALYSDNQWGMTVDLNACTGCNACVTACQSENNVPIVGKDQVSRGREMHWLRLDRYYVGGEEGQDASNVGVLAQPMMCVHCENAPCEQVCPVNATVHSPDGINAMVYNRCIGTRYCANNCPYKVRRYNFYNWTKALPLETQMQSNPYVTVRYRGVMEKCTFCVQRVRKVQQYAHVEGRPLEDGEVVTACQQACPAEAIVFGDLRDAESAVSRSKQSPRNYAVLAELAVKPRLTYLARVRNPNPALEAYDPFRVEPQVPAHPGGAHGDEHVNDAHAEPA